MNKIVKAEEIINQLTALSNEKYTKSEYLPEVISLQKQIAEIAFNNQDSEARIWDTYNYLEQLDSERRNIARKELEKFKQDCKVINNKIRAEISGNRGENLTGYSLEKVKSVNRVLRNVELEVDGIHTEIDFIVLTKKAIFIIEVKNTSSNIFISDSGEYYRCGKHMCLDSKIKEKMKLREELLSKVLNEAGFFRINIVSLLVFTNNRIDVENNCKDINATFLSQLPYKIDGYSGWNMFTEDCIYEMADAINTSKITGEYTFDMDTDIIKRDFAELMVALSVEENKSIRLISKIKQLFIKNKVA